jgi:hypothetical protein
MRWICAVLALSGCYTPSLLPNQYTAHYDAPPPTKEEVAAQEAQRRDEFRRFCAGEYPPDGDLNALRNAYDRDAVVAAFGGRGSNVARVTGIRAAYDQERRARCPRPATSPEQ